VFERGEKREHRRVKREKRGERTGERKEKREKRKERRDRIPILFSDFGFFKNLHRAPNYPSQFVVDYHPCAINVSTIVESISTPPALP
jgi:hypothetical protein